MLQSHDLTLTLTCLSQKCRGKDEDFIAIESRNGIEVVPLTFLWFSNLRTTSFSLLKITSGT